jgi:hypothetical protein
MTINYGVFAQAEVGFSPGRAKVADGPTIGDNNMHFVGCVPPGHHAQLIVKKDTTDVDVAVNCSMSSRWSNSVTEIGCVINTADPPLDLYDPEIGFPVFVGKYVSGSADFKVGLCITDSPSMEAGKQYPRLVDCKGSSGVVNASVVTSVKPVGLEEDDLLIAFVGCSDHTAAMGATPVEKNAAGWVADADWTEFGSLDANLDPRIRVFYKLADATDESTVTDYRWNFAAGPFDLAVNVLAFRTAGAGSLDDYGMGASMIALGIPSIWGGASAGAKTGTTTNVSNAIESMDMQIAPCDVDTSHLVFTPCMAVCCFAAGDWDTPPTTQFSGVQSQASVDPLVVKTSAEVKAGNVMLSAAAVVIAQYTVQLSGMAYFNGTPFAYQGGYIVLGQFS